MKKIKAIGYGIGLTLLPFITSAQVVLPNPTVTTPQGLLGILCNLTNWFFTVFLVLAIVFVLLAAFKYVTASGDEEKVKKANHQIIYAVVAVIVAVLAKGLPLIIANLVGQGGVVNAC